MSFVGYSMAKILIIDDEKQIRRVIGLQLEKSGHEVRTCANGQEGIEAIEAGRFDLVISDLQMPKVTGIEFLEYIREAKISIPIIVMTAFGSVETAVEAMKLGAVDYISKPLQLAELVLKAERILSRRGLVEENKRLKKELAGKFRMGKIVGKSPAMQKIIEQLKPLANDRNISVLLIGESGTGKELTASAIHYNSPRTQESFVAVNCGALPENLLESELFGHEQGAFTDAKELKKGLFEVANRGTLFLDEIGSMPMTMQVKLLRAIEEGTIRRVGGTKNIAVDVRFIAASNQDLEELVKKGEFRHDLYYRLAVATVKLPPLRDRDGDIRLLAQLFLEKFNLEKGRELTVEPDVFRRFEKHYWGGNVRELENLIELLVVTSPNETISVSALPEALLNGNADSNITFSSGKLKGNLKTATKNFERDFITSRLDANDRNVSKTAKEIGISRSTLHAKIKDLGI